jgi:hypothetical protein
MKPLALAVAFLSMMSIARADVLVSDLRQFEKGKTTYDDVVQKLGPPTRTEYNDEGLRAVAYVDQHTQLNAASVLSVLGTAASIFMPVPSALATSAGSYVTELMAGGANGTSSVVALVFDKNGLLMYYRAVLGAVNVNTFASTSSTNVITSEDGAAPMPNLKATPPTEEQLRKIPPITPGDKPRLGIQFVPIGAISPEQRDQFAAAKFNGLIVMYVVNDSAAQRAGIHVSDYLYVLNGMLVTSAADVAQAMSTVQRGDRIKARIKRIDSNAHLSREQIVELQF